MSDRDTQQPALKQVGASTASGGAVPLQRLSQPQAAAPAKGPQGQGKPAPAAPKPAGPPPPAPVIIRPVAEKAHVRKRHWGLLLSFLLAVLLPFVAAVYYLWGHAQDQYASTTGFTVRQEEGGSPIELLGGLSQLAGGASGGASDSDILYEYIQSQVLVERISQRIDLPAIYGQNWEVDPVFSLWPDAEIEDVVWFWQRVVRISYDQGSGLIELRVLAPTPDTAQGIATAIVEESQGMINNLNAAARDDTMRNATGELDLALERLRGARQALTAFRSRTQIVDPEADIQSRMGVISTLQQQLAQALIDYDLLSQQAQDSDPRVQQAARTIDVIRARIADEREGFTLSDEALGGEDYPELIAEYESLVVDREFAETTYTSALAAVDIARADASRQSRYLATYIEPTLAQSAEFPQRLTVAGLVGMFLLLTWGVVALIYYALRDRR